MDTPSDFPAPTNPQEPLPNGQRIELVPVTAGDDPFVDHPSLQDIWPEPYRGEAARISRVHSATGEIFYVALDGVVVGITGVFFEENIAPEDVYLRWTGVVPTARQEGLGRSVIRLVAQLCQERYPTRKRLIELVPDNAYGHAIPKPFFEKIGFLPCDIGIPSGEDKSWPVIAYAGDIHRLST